MMELSRNLKIFGALGILYSLVFHYYYSGYVAGGEWNNVILAAVLYGVCMFATGLFLGAKDPVRDTRMDQGFQYHLVTYIVVNGTGILWALVGLSAERETVGVAFLTALSWGMGLLVHFLVVRHFIKGMPRKDVFE